VWVYIPLVYVVVSVAGYETSEHWLLWVYIPLVYVVVSVAGYETSDHWLLWVYIPLVYVVVSVAGYEIGKKVIDFVMTRLQLNMKIHDSY